VTAGPLERKDPGRLATDDVDVRAGRLAAGLALASASLHVLSVTMFSTGSFVMVAMALLCLPCAWHLWNSPTASVWLITALLDLGMLGVHAGMVLSVPDHGADHAAAADHVHWTEPACLALVLVVASLLLSLRALAAEARTGGRRNPT
jgi:hypothetical protein